MKQGSTAGPFWDEFGVKFDKSEFVRLPYILEIESAYESWMERYHIAAVTYVSFIAIILYSSV